eukprot:2570893-Pyramimonas_sp.AAC.4
MPPGGAHLRQLDHAAYDLRSDNLTVYSPISLGQVRNFMSSLHGGAAAAVVDLTTTAALMATVTFPGVTASLTVDYLAPCKPSDILRVRAPPGGLCGRCKRFRGGSSPRSQCQQCRKCEGGHHHAGAGGVKGVTTTQVQRV